MQKAKLLIFGLILLLFVLMAAIFYQKRNLQKIVIDSKAPNLSQDNVHAPDSGTFFFDCLADLDHISYGLVVIEPKLNLRAWTTCTFKTKENGTQTMTLPLWIENISKSNYFVTTSLAGTHFTAERGPMMEGVIKIILNKVLVDQNFSGPTEVNIGTGNNSESLIKVEDPLSEILSSSSGSKMLAFGKSLDIANLPNINGLINPIVLPYRVEKTNVK